MDDNGGEWVQETVDGNSFWFYYDSNGDRVTGWIKSNGYWYYCYGDGTMAHDTMVNGYYVNNDGQWTTEEHSREIIHDNGDHFWYHIGPNGKAVTGWNKIGDNFHYYNYPGGSMTYDNTIKGSYSDSEEFYIDDDGNIASGTGWIKDEYSGKCYYYLEGSMQTGWVNYGDSWYYLKDDGSMATGWQYVNGFWYYLQSDGSMAANKWVNDGTGWYYLYKDGSMARGATANGYYVCQETGKMVTGAGWKHIDNKYFYLNGDDSVVTGWLKDKNIWYYFYPENSDSDSQGEMAEDTTIDGWNVGDDGGWINGTGWKQNGDDWYYFDDNGKMITNTWIQGKDSDDWYYVDSDGKMLQSTGRDFDGIRIGFDGNGVAHTFEDTGGDAQYNSDVTDAIMLLNPVGRAEKVIVNSADKFILKDGSEIIAKDAVKGAAKATRLTAPEAKKLAESIGFKKVNANSHGQPVFYNSKLKKYITPDVDSHNGGVWKMANSIEELASKRTRLGTYDANLNRIGD
ncbi:hypothetical protein LF65_04923 [Clostridium beijerinckii]|uniref:Novel toxin 21 domain-containing protein n=1 Tax=Clostridium beijerinckii TaxID=1520 RepID=A0A0B5QT66_CLOBE|nr:toxin C-terminal domain-containing protein [Clostridium beijerinckii]AJH01452.1 hypothetical protein LF65_04923 [Clostridium beijerinckii]